MSKVDKTPIDPSDVVSNMSGMTIFTPLGATNAPSVQGEESARDLSVTIDPTRLTWSKAEDSKGSNLGRKRG